MGQTGLTLSLGYLKSTVDHDIKGPILECANVAGPRSPGDGQLRDA